MNRNGKANLLGCSHRIMCREQLQLLSGRHSPNAAKVKPPNIIQEFKPERKWSNICDIRRTKQVKETACVQSGPIEDYSGAISSININQQQLFEIVLMGSASYRRTMDGFIRPQFILFIFRRSKDLDQGSLSQKSPVCAISPIDEFFVYFDR